MNQKSNRWLVTILFLVALCLVVACERTSKEIGGGDGAPKDAPKYASDASRYELPGDVSVSIGEKSIDAEALFAQHCSACHQINGAGIPGAFPPLDGSEWVVGDDVEQMAAIIVYGLSGPITVKGVEYNSVMAPLGRLSDKEIAGIMTYIRGAWSNSAGAVEPEVVAEVRQRWGQRGMLTVAELKAN